MFSSANASVSSRIRKRQWGKFLRNLENGATIGYKLELGNFQEFHMAKTKQRAYDEQRECLGNYKTVLFKEEALQKVIDKGLEEGLVSGPFS